MKTGTKSLLFGVHQFIWHPITVWLAWKKLNGKRPNWKETVCIIVHDWGYWGCAKMDDENGERHPEFGAAIAGWLFDKTEHVECADFNEVLQKVGDGWEMEGVLYKRWFLAKKSTQYHDLVLLHSRHLAHTLNREPSRLCWPDKLSVIFEPRWFYLLRAGWSGEVKEYVANGERYHGRPLTQTEWFDWLQGHLTKVANERVKSMQHSSRLGAYKV